MVPDGGFTAAREPLARLCPTEMSIAESQNDQTELEPLDDEALEEVAGGSSGQCCSCSYCSSRLPD